jgi:hypothetical protein
MSRTLLSWYTLFQHDVFSAFGKLASLWFNDIVFQVPDANTLSNVLGKLVSEGTLSNRIADELTDIWIPVQEVLPDYHFLDVLQNDEWRSKNKKLLKASYEVASEATLNDYPNADPNEPGFQHEARWFSYGIIDTVAIWSALNTQNSYGLLANPEGSKVIQQLFALPQRNREFDLFSEVVEQRLPNFDELSWEKVLELRNHQFLENFRSKLVEVQNKYRESDIIAAAEIVQEMELNDLRTLARMVRSSGRMTLIKFIVSNIPLPIPVNPVSVGLGIKDLATERVRTAQFGWLYFLLDLQGRQ